MNPAPDQAKQGATRHHAQQIGENHREPGLLRREATSQFFPATVHGAFLSGVRAAYEIMLADAKADLMKDGQEEFDILRLN